MPTIVTTRGMSISTMATITPTTRTTIKQCGWFAADSCVHGRTNSAGAWMRKSGEYSAPNFSFTHVWNAYQSCRKTKRAKVRTCLYEQRLLDNIQTTSERLIAHTWQPKPPILFMVTQPKLREVHAAVFEDRVVHHVLMHYLEPLFEREFVFDATSNRKGKGTHFGVNRLSLFMRQHAQAGYFLQLDIKNFFYSVDHAILLGIIDSKLTKWLKKGHVNSSLYNDLRWLCHQIVANDGRDNAMVLGDIDSRRGAPHKQLRCIDSDKGLPIGNLTSQLFANVYMNELDQFVKHELKCKHYVRYVDDFVLCHTDKTHLLGLKTRIEDFLARRLGLTLRSPTMLKPMRQGCDFLGYIVRGRYRLVRRRVIDNFNQKIKIIEQQWRQSKNTGVLYNLNPNEMARLTGVVASYWGHFSHSDAYHLKASLYQRHQLLRLFFCLNSPDNQCVNMTHPKEIASFFMQWHYFKDYVGCGFQVSHPSGQLLMQCGKIIISCSFIKGVTHQSYRHPRLTGLWQFHVRKLTQARQRLEGQGVSYALVTE